MRRYVCYIGTEGQENTDKYFRRIKREVTEQGKFGSDPDSAVVFIKNDNNRDVEIVGLP